MKREVKNKIKGFFIKLLKLIKSNIGIILMVMPFIIMDLFTRCFAYKVTFYPIYKLAPNLFTISYIVFIVGISLAFKKKIGKILYSLFFVICITLFLVNNVYYSMTDSFFDFSLMMLASEGSSYLMDAIVNCNIWVYIFFIFNIAIYILALKHYPKVDKNNYKTLSIVLIVFLTLQIITPLFLGKKDEELTWSTWRNPRNIYINFNDNNKSMKVSGLYEYSIRNFYITFLKPKKTTNETEIAFLEETYNTENENKKDSYTGLLEGKNLIIVQLEGIDSWLINKTDTPTLYKMMKNSINFTKHYSYYNGGGSTFNSEFAVNTGFITPLSYTQNAYTFSKSTFPYTLAKLFKSEGYTINAFHMNSSEYYSRGANYKNWGYDNYYGLVDMYDYKDSSYQLDREMILNEDFSNKMFENEKFINYLITYSTHMPFTTEKGVCKQLITLDELTRLGVDKLPKNYELPELTEEECARRQAKETDYMMELLLEKLEEKELSDNTAIVLFADHYLYTLTDQTILDKYKETDNNLINNTPFFIYNNGKTKKTVKSVTSQLNVLPTLLNLFDIDYNKNYYIGENALAKNYKGYVFFSDYSWYNGKVYVDGGYVTNNKYISEEELENSNYYINSLIKKNDLTLKYDYFKTIINKENPKVVE